MDMNNQFADNEKARKALLSLLEDQKETLSKLKESEELFRNLAEATSSAIFVYKNEKFVYVNKTVELITGYSSNELLSMNFWDIVHPDYKELIKQRELAQQRGENVPSRYEFKLTNKAGNDVWVDFSAAKIKTWQGEPATIGTAIDITEKKEEEQRKQKRENFLRIYQKILLESATSNFIVEGDLEKLSCEINEKISKELDIARVSIWLLNEDTNALECVDMYDNNKKQHSSGYKLFENEFKNEFDALMSSKYVDASDPYSDPRTKGYINTYLSPNKITSMLDCGINYSGKNAGTLCLEHVNQKHTWTIDEIDFGCQIADQISICLSNRGKKIAEKKLRESEEKYRLIAENTADTIAVFDLNLNLLYVSPSVKNLLGYEPEEIMTLGLKNILTKESYEESLKLLENELKVEYTETADPKRSLIVILKGIKKDKTIIDVETVVSFIRDKKGKAISILTISRDISERLKAEKALQLKDKLLDVKNKIGEILLLNQDTDSAINKSLEYICNITGQDRCYIFEYHYDKQQQKDVISQRYEFAKEDVSAQINNPEMLNLPLRDIAPSWSEALISGKNVESEFDRLTPEMHKILKEQQIFSLILVPIYIHGNFWGFIGLDNCHEEFKWTDFEREILKTSGIFMGMTILRKRTEESLKKSEEKMRLLVEGTSYFFFYTHDKNGMVTYISPSVEKITGYSGTEWLNQNHWFATDSPINVTAQERTRSLLNGKIEKKTLNLEIFNKKKEKILLEIYEAPIYSGNDIIGIQGIAHDVTERNRLYERIRILSCVIEQNPLSIVITDIDGNIEYVNPKFCEVTGYTYEEVLGQNPRIFKSGLTPEETYPVLWANIKSGKTWNGELCNKKKDGSYYWENAIVSPVTDENGVITNFVEIKEDITQKKDLDDKLIKSEKELKEIWKSSIDAMRLIDDNGIILNVNEAYCKLFGIERESLVGKEFTLPYGILEVDKSLEHFKEKFRTKMIQPKFETKIMLHSKNEIWVELTNSFIDLKSGKSMLLTIFRDITEHKNLINDLITARQKAEAADKLKSDFLAQISHEIRSPLNVVINNTSLLKNFYQEFSDEERDDIFSGINNSSQRIIRTVDLILNSSEMQLGTYNPIFKQIDIYKNIAERAFKEFKLYASGRGLKLKFLSTVKKAEIVCDEYSVYQSLVNLVDNAIKYTKRGSIEIRLSRNDKRKLQLEVIDTGIGISEEYQKHLFEPFTQEETGYTRKFEGTGLGLSLVKKYCDMNNIQIQVESKKNSGTTFRLIFMGLKQYFINQ